MTTFLDPYKTIDPTIAFDGKPIQGRSVGGKFTNNSILSAMSDDHFPINSSYWKRFAKGAFLRLEAIIGEDRYDRIQQQIIPDEYVENFSWRMICEMFEAACESAEKEGLDRDIVNAAHDHLTQKQKETSEKLSQ